MKTQFDRIADTAHGGCENPMAAPLPALLGLSCLLLIASLGFTAGAQTIVNPSFEVDPVPPGNGDGPITGWTGGTGINDATGPLADNGTIPDGQKVAFIYGPGTMSQIVQGFTLGAGYRLRYYENARSCCAPRTANLQVTVGGVTVVPTHEVVSVGGSNPYAQKVTEPFTATAEVLEIVFVTSGTGDFTVLLDNVELIGLAGTILGAGTFTNTSPLNIARVGHTATLLANGKVLVVGGRVPTNPTADCQIYDPATGLWTAAEPLKYARSDHTATLLHDGKVLVAGGEGFPMFLREAELYDPATGHWDFDDNDPCTPSGLVAYPIAYRTRQTATLVPSFNPGAGGLPAVILVGGRTHGGDRLSGDVFNCRQDSLNGVWSLTDLYKPFPPPSLEREMHTAALLPRSRVLITGGAIYSFQSGTFGPPLATTMLNTHWLANEFVTGAPMATARQNHTATTLLNSKVLVTGGWNTTGTLASSELFDPPTEPVHQLPGPGSWSPTGGNGTGWFAQYYRDTGGSHLAGTPVESHNDATINFDGASGWPATLVPALGPTDFSVRWSGQFLAPATATYTFYTTSDDGVRLYLNGAPIIDNWTGHAPTVNSATVVLNAGQLYPIVLEYFQGPGGAVISLEYEAAGAGIARQLVSADRVLNVFAARERHTATLMRDGRVLVVGGLNGAPLASAQLYDPATGLWNAAHSLNTARYQHTATLLANGRVLVVGGLGANGASLASAEIYDTRFADLVVEQPLQTAIPDGGATDLGLTTPGVPLSFDFFIKNPGSLPLTGITLTVDGANAADFIVTRNPPASLLALGGGAFTLQFAPTDPGVKTATIHIANSSSPALGKSPYDISLTARLLSNTADTDGDGISDAQEWLMKSLGFDWRVSQPALAATYFATANDSGLYNQAQYDANRTAGRNDVTGSPNSYGLYTSSQFDSNRTAGRNDVINAPNTYGLYSLAQYNTNRILGRNDVINSPISYGLYSTEQIQDLNVDMPLLAKNPTNGLFKLTIGVQATTNVAQPFVAFPMNGPGMSTAINEQGKLELQFPGQGNIAFYRLQTLGNGAGWKAQYYSDPDGNQFTGSPVATRRDATIDFIYVGDPSGWPNTLVVGLGPNNFSVRWTGQFVAPATATYTFYTRSDDGVRLYLNGQTIIENWTDHPTTTNSASITLNAGQSYPMVLEYYQRGGQAVISLEYEATAVGIPRQIVPANRVF